MAASKKGVVRASAPPDAGYYVQKRMVHGDRVREAMGVSRRCAACGRPRRRGRSRRNGIAPSRKTKVRGGRKRANNPKFVALVERDGKVRSAVIDGRNMRDVREAVRSSSCIPTAPSIPMVRSSIRYDASVGTKPSIMTRCLPVMARQAAFTPTPPKAISDLQAWTCWHISACQPGPFAALSG